jgi:hypothetical protein
LVGLAALVAASCAVFPDRADLPLQASGAAGSAHTGGQSSKGDGGAGRDSMPAQAGSDVAGQPDAAGTSLGGAPDAPVAGAGGTELGASGAAGEPAVCTGPVQRIVPIDLDTWISSRRQTTGYSGDATLSVVGAPDERRAMLQFTVPVPNDGNLLTHAELTLRLQANADATSVSRLLGLHRLSHEIDSKTTWKKFSNGSQNWDTSGGDFGVELARASVPAGTSEATLTFDVSEEIRGSSAPVTVSVVILEIGAAPAAPAELAFGALEGDASKAPQLILTYCEP